jgi:hypothetical protein
MINKICIAYSLIDTFPLEPTIKIIPLIKLKTNLISNFFITKNYHRRKKNYSRIVYLLKTVLNLHEANILAEFGNA